MDIEGFLAANKIKKKTLAEYLGISAAGVTSILRNGKMADDKLARLLNNDRGWDTSSLLLAAPSKRDLLESEIEFLRGEIQALRKIVNNQSAIISRYEAIIQAVYKIKGEDK